MRTGNFVRYVERLLYPYYGREEARSIARLLLDDMNISWHSWQTMQLRNAQKKRVDSIIRALKAGCPIQYLLGYAYFLGKKFLVNSNVLIPRRETEELVHLVAKEQRGRTALRLLDIGAGCGCIAIALAALLEDSMVHALDNDEKTLTVGRKNARLLGAQVHFFCHDMRYPPPGARASYDIITSNPPYVCPSERSYLMRRVLHHEPHAALFSPSADPLFFYRRLAVIAQHALCSGGAVYLEVHERRAEEVCRLLEASGLQRLRLHRDLMGKERMVVGER